MLLATTIVRVPSASIRLDKPNQHGILMIESHTKGRDHDRNNAHAMHMEHSILCLEHKKAVLCEKAFAMNVKEVDQMIAASRDNETFLMEAFWTIFQPKFNKVLELAKDPELGRLKFIKSDFMFNADFDPDKRLYNIDLGAGSLLDIGIYPIFRSMMFLGKPEKIKVFTD